jgi:hypothetical protein
MKEKKLLLRFLLLATKTETDRTERNVVQQQQHITASFFRVTLA